MTYTFKISRRLAISHRAGVFGVALAAAACSSPDAIDGFAPDSPADAAIAAVVLAPEQTTTVIGQPARFTAYARTAAGDSLLLAAEELEWSASGGTITQDGLFSATAAGTYALIARDRRRNRADTSRVVVRPPSVTLTAVAVAPEAATVAVGAKQAFTATGTFSDGTSAAVTPTWTATGGMIDAAGVYTAGGAPGTYRVIATASGGALADTVVVTIPAAAPPPPPPPTEPEPEPEPEPTLTAVVLTPDAATLAAGATQQFSATGRLSDGSTTSSVAVTWTATGGTVSSAGRYTAGGTAGTYHVIAMQQGGTLADTAIVTVTAPAPPPPPPPPPSGSNEPSGYAKITERAFNAKAENGWTDRGDAHFSIVQDANAPRSAPSVGQAFYPKGYPSGTGPISTQYSISGGKREIYVSFDIQVSANWYGNDAGVNKIFFLWMHDNPSVYLSAQGAGTGRLEPQVRLQNTPMGSPVLRPNLVSSAEIVRGRWQRWELVMKANTPGVADGEVHWWIDGRKVGEHKGIQFAGSGQANSWQLIDWNPTYGGLGAPVPNDQYQRIDHVYVSGR